MMGFIMKLSCLALVYISNMHIENFVDGKSVPEMNMSAPHFQRSGNDSSNEAKSVVQTEVHDEPLNPFHDFLSKVKLDTQFTNSSRIKRDANYDAFQDDYNGMKSYGFSSPNDVSTHYDFQGHSSTGNDYQDYDLQDQVPIEEGSIYHNNDVHGSNYQDEYSEPTFYESDLQAASTLDETGIPESTLDSLEIPFLVVPRNDTFGEETKGGNRNVSSTDLSFFSALKKCGRCVKSQVKKLIGRKSKTKVDSKISDTSPDLQSAGYDLPNYRIDYDSYDFNPQENRLPNYDRNDYASSNDFNSGRYSRSANYQTDYDPSQSNFIEHSVPSYDQTQYESEADFNSQGYGSPNYDQPDYGSHATDLTGNEWADYNSNVDELTNGDLQEATANDPNVATNTCGECFKYIKKTFRIDLLMSGSLSTKVLFTLLKLVA